MTQRMERCLRPSLCQGRSILLPRRSEICCSSLLGILSTARAALSVHLSSHRLLQKKRRGCLWRQHDIAVFASLGLHDANDVCALPISPTICAVAERARRRFSALAHWASFGRLERMTAFHPLLKFKVV